MGLEEVMESVEYSMNEENKKDFCVEDVGTNEAFAYCSDIMKN
jgi:hypothetical protein